MSPQVQKQLRYSLLATFHYFDVLGVRPTIFELYKYWLNPNRFGPAHVPPRVHAWPLLRETVDGLEKQGQITQAGGFYFLTTTKTKPGSRIRQAKQTDQKLKRAQRIVGVLRGVPFLRGVLISGSVALGYARPSSDIDLLIVTAPGRIWLTRTFVTLITGLKRMRRHDNLTRDRACLNHYITSDSLRIEHPSLYNAMTYGHLIPLFETIAAQGQALHASSREFREQQKLGQSQLLQRFFAANDWLKAYFFKVPEATQYRWHINDSGKSRGVRKTCEWLLAGWLGDWLEKLTGSFQARRIERDPRTTASGGRVEISRHALEFHPDSQEKQILANYNERLWRHISDELNVERDSGLKS